LKEVVVEGGGVNIKILNEPSQEGR
jgi:hypothetical protein